MDKEAHSDQFCLSSLDGGRYTCHFDYALHSTHTSKLQKVNGKPERNTVNMANDLLLCTHTIFVYRMAE
jgi:hypothetical protein